MEVEGKRQKDRKREHLNGESTYLCPFTEGGHCRILKPQSMKRNLVRIFLEIKIVSENRLNVEEETVYKKKEMG